MANTTGIAATPSRARREQATYSSSVRKYGRDSVQARTAEAEYWCARLCTLIEDSIAQHPLTDEQRQRVADAALNAGRWDHVTVRQDDGTTVKGRIVGTPNEPN